MFVHVTLSTSSETEKSIHVTNNVCGMWSEHWRVASAKRYSVGGGTSKHRATSGQGIMTGSAAARGGRLKCYGIAGRAIRCRNGRRPAYALPWANIWRSRPLRRRREVQQPDGYYCVNGCSNITRPSLWSGALVTVGCRNGRWLAQRCWLQYSNHFAGRG
jgi:hypothetical protein